jgi:outer membrane lipoprotein SlyB
MKTETARSKGQRKPVILIAGIVAALFCSAGIATIMDWGVAPGKPLGERTRLIALLRGDANRGAVDQRDAHDAGAVARPTARCVGCGVIESILVVDMRDETTGVCAAGDWVDHGFRDHAPADAGGRDPATLSEIVADVVIKNFSARSVQSATSHELTVRFPDGVKSTIRLVGEPRFRPGERVRVINNQT